MSSFKLIISSAVMATLAMGIAIPSTTSMPPKPPITINSTMPSVPQPTIDCHHKWCQNGTSMCIYWAGITGYDPSLGPIPGETVTVLGSCATPTAAGNKERDLEANKMLITPAPTATSTINCSYKYCESSTQYCMYWAGVTGWDVSLGPIPGMVRTSLGSCEAPAATPTANLPVTY